jgi:hypothetical protein
MQSKIECCNFVMSLRRSKASLLPSSLGPFPAIHGRPIVTGMFNFFSLNGMELKIRSSQIATQRSRTARYGINFPFFHRIFPGHTTIH